MKIKRMLACILLLALMLNTTIVFAADEITAAKAGYDDGLIFVLEKYNYGDEIPLYPIVPDQSSVNTKYYQHLTGKNQAYKTNFYIEYQFAYIEGYTQGRSIYMPPDSEQPLPDIEANYAESLGTILGETYAYNDYYNNVNSNWTKAIPTNNKIIEMFDLNRETASYRTVFLSEFREKFKESYEESFEFALLDNKDTIIGSAVENGKDIGIILGAIYGGKDYFDGRSNNYKRNLPTDSSIINDYNLSRTLPDYKTGFVNGFKLGYEEGYNEAYYNSFKEADEAGREAGELKGEMLAVQDYISNKTMSWSRHKSLESTIRNEYRLIYLSNVYSDSFLNGFWAGFAQKYDETYKALTNEQVTEKIAFGIIPISGGVLSSGDNSIALEIQSGTFYNDTTLSIEKVFNDRYKVDESRYIGTSDIYNIQLSNPSKNMDNSKAITIAMEYYGKYDGGIYKWVNNRWSYIPSQVEDGMIVAQVNPNTLRSGDNLYRVLIDKNYTILTDIRNHWGKDEINTLIRRDIINGYPDMTFKADRNISRAEFLALLSRVYDWNLSRNVDNVRGFSDHERFGAMEGVISYGLRAGYIIGYEDGTFKPNQTISYKEIEIIMGRLLKDPTFKWYNTSASMIYDKQVRSNSYKNMNNKITRAEVAYMLYILNEWRY